RLFGKKPKAAKEPKEPKQKKPLPKGLITRIVLIICIVAAVAGIGGLAYYGWGYISARQTYSNIEKQADVTITMDVAEGTDEIPHITIDWDALRKVSPNIVGWIYIPDTKVSYPIVQASDNDYYLYRDANGKSSRSGAIYMDCDSKRDFSDLHSIIYGHSMQDGSMFRCLLKYPEGDFWDQHPYIYLVTPDNVTHRLLIFSAYTERSSGEMRRTYFDNDNRLKDYIARAQQKSCRDIGVDVSGAKHLYSFITCDYQYTAARMLVQAVEVDAQGNVIK
ncbi:MAG: class B sortase, partial [Coriobacteriales bacterium]|nr:class B sortase [Coriobacteriales bacterium]